MLIALCLNSMYVSTHIIPLCGWCWKSLELGQSNLSHSGMLFVALHIVVHVYGIGLCCLVACILCGSCCCLQHGVRCILCYKWSYTRQCKRISGHAGGALQVKHCLKMPMYPATLSHIPISMDESAVLICGKKLKTTLQDIHARGYGHNDVKAANVFISETGEQSIQLLPSSEYVLH